MAQRTYRVDGHDGKPRLVRTSHPNNALRHVAETAFTVRVATQDDLIELLPQGVKVEQPQAEQLPLDGAGD